MESQVVTMQQQMAELQQVMRHNVSLQVLSSPLRKTRMSTVLERSAAISIVFSAGVQKSRMPISARKMGKDPSGFGTKSCRLRYCLRV